MQLLAPPHSKLAAPRLRISAFGFLADCGLRNADCALGFSLLAALFWLGPALAVEGGTMTTLAGDTYTGEVRWEGSNVVVSPAAGPAVGFSLAQVRQVRFVEEPTMPNRPVAATVQPRPPRVRFGGRLGNVRVEYFADRELKESRLSRLDESIDRYWPDGITPSPEVPTLFAGRWLARLHLAAWGGTNANGTLVIKCDGGARLWLDGRLVLDTWAKPEPDRAWPVPVLRGQTHDFRLEYWRSQPQGYLMVHQWNFAHDRLQPVPSACFLAADNRTNLPPELVLVGPEDGSVLLPGEKLCFEVAVSDPRARLREVQFRERSARLVTLTQPPWQALLAPPSPGVHRYNAQATTERDLTLRSLSAGVCVAEGKEAPLPAPWWCLPFGFPATATTAGWTNDQLTLSQRGGWLRGGGDTFGCVARQAEGDFELTARLVHLETSRPPADPLAGLVVQEQFRPTAPRTSLVWDGATNVLHLRRTEDGGPLAERAEPVAGPVWLRLTRRGGAVASALSTNGERWQLLDADPARWPGPVWVGFVVCGSNANAIVTARFDHISFTNLIARSEGAVSGVLLASGSFLTEGLLPLDSLRLEGEVATVRVAGQTNPVTLRASDLARFLYKPVNPNDLAIRHDRVGLLLWGGDFVEGTVAALSNRVLTADSILFGRKNYVGGEEVAAVLLREPKPATMAWRVGLQNGSTVMARSLTLAGSTVTLDEPLLGPLSLPQREVAEFERTYPPR